MSTWLFLTLGLLMLSWWLFSKKATRSQLVSNLYLPWGLPVWNLSTYGPDTNRRTFEIMD